MLRIAVFAAVFFTAAAPAQVVIQRPTAPVAGPTLTPQQTPQTLALATQRLEGAQADVRRLQSGVQGGRVLRRGNPCEMGRAAWQSCTARIRAAIVSSGVGEAHRAALDRSVADVEAEMERVRNARDTSSTDFQAVDQKLNALYEMLTQVVKTISEERNLGSRRGE